jgi:putative ABC transport system permease protein
MNGAPFQRDKLDLYKTKLLQNAGVAGVSADQGGRWGTVAHINGNNDISFDMKIVDEEYFRLLEIPIVKGRSFSSELSSDSAEGVMVNESFVKVAGWKEPIGEVLDFFYNKKKYYVIGVVKDYHFASLNEKIGPQIFLTHPQYQLRDIYVKVQPNRIAEVLPFLQKSFKEFFPLQPYDFKFKDAENELQYANEQKWKQIMAFGATLTIFISCIGLFGLSMLAAERRTKEIGIRKVLGASVSVIVRSLSASFLKLVLLSAVIAIPVAVIFTEKWLQNYPYHVQIAWWIYALAVIPLMVIALITVSFQSVKAAFANPVNNLRTE